MGLRSVRDLAHENVEILPHELPYSGTLNFTNLIVSNRIIEEAPLSIMF
jgi:hypothetical protein